MALQIPHQSFITTPGSTIDLLGIFKNLPATIHVPSFQPHYTLFIVGFGVVVILFGLLEHTKIKFSRKKDVRQAFDNLQTNLKEKNKK